MNLLREKGDRKATRFGTSNSKKQGGNISPLLFSSYVYATFSFNNQSD